jgi:hypothetical protein
MLRLSEQVIGRACFDDAAEIHDGDALTNALHRREIVGDKGSMRMICRAIKTPQRSARGKEPITGEQFAVFLALLALIGVGGCSTSGPEPSFEAAYSAIGAQVK